MRPDRLLAGIALTVVLALVAVPDIVGHRMTVPTVSPEAFEPVLLDDVVGMATSRLDPAARSAASIAATTSLIEPAPDPVQRARADAPRPTALGGSVFVPPPAPKPAAKAGGSGGGGSGGSWRTSGSSWYGPGLYGNGTACGQTLTRTLIGVANRTLPCGTLVEFRNPENGRVVRARVVDRGPYVTGRTWDLTHGLCAALDHCYTAPIQWRLP